LIFDIKEGTLGEGDNRVLRRIFELKRDEVIGGRRELHNEELHNLYLSPNILREIKSRRKRCAIHAARMRKRYCCKAKNKEIIMNTKM
jgi:hypothetical protein